MLTERVERAKYQCSNSTGITQNALGKGRLAPLRIQLIQRLDQSTLERGQAALPTAFIELEMFH